jgi:hypothetical protein
MNKHHEGSMMHKAIPIVCCLFLLFGCATQQPLTREEALKQRSELLTVTTKTYPGCTKEDVLKASEKILRLADSDFKFRHTENAIIGDRPWGWYFLIDCITGWDTWVIASEEKDGTTRVAVRTIQDKAGFPAMVTGSSLKGTGEWTVDKLPNLEDAIQSKALYQVFFKRLDYMLGKEKKWMGCTEARTYVEENKMDGELTAICDPLTIDDQYPK